MVNIKSVNYQELLLKLIPNLKNFPFSTGGEGTAYFINQDLVVKEITTPENPKIFDLLFKKYCNEVANFKKRGFNTPTIYAWTKIQAQPQQFSELEYRYFILEERIKGRPLYYSFWTDYVDCCSKICSYSEFYDATRDPHAHFKLFKTLVESYMKNFIDTNATLEAMNQNDLDKFITDTYKMHTTSHYCEPDLHPSNVLLRQSTLKIIDPKIINTSSRDFSRNELDNNFIHNLISLFNYNSGVSQPNHNLLFLLHNPSALNTNILSEKNKQILKEVLIRFIKSMNSNCDRPKLTDYRYYRSILNELETILGTEASKSVINEINVEIGP